MRPWIGQAGQCMFCEFRALVRRKPRAILSRQFHLASAQHKEISDPGFPVRKVLLDRSLVNTNRPPVKARRTGLIPKNDGRKTPLRISRLAPREGDFSAQVISNFHQHLQDLKNSLSRKNPIEGSGISPLDSLDPDGTKWPAFEEKIKLLFKQKKSGQAGSWTREQLNIFKKLTKVNGPVEARTALHYAFADHALEDHFKSDSRISMKVLDLRYPTEWYIKARASQRDIHLHVGPTNSGKTYNALKRLEEAGNGFYAGPLRLLAHEVYSRFVTKGIQCDLVTGDDIRRNEDGETKLYASTVEMVDISREVDVGVIDEIQMIAQDDRGWAWTRAFLGANAKELHLCGETRVIPLIRELTASIGDTLHIHQYDRLNPLKAMTKSLRGNLRSLRKGDCIVSFSVMGIHALKKQIEMETGRRVAIVYGSLPPETRARQAALFNEPDNDYDFLVASNAIGMGLNLAVKRVVFESISRFNGTHREVLSVPEIKQIAGRAGRFKTALQNSKHETAEKNNTSTVQVHQHHATTHVGLVTCLDEADLPVIQMALATEPEPIKSAAIFPPIEFIEEYSARLPKGLPFAYIMQRLCEEASLNPRFKLCAIGDTLAIVRQLEPFRDLSILQRCTIAAAPADFKSSEGRQILRSLVNCIATQKKVTVADIPEIPLETLEMPMSAERDYLRGLEVLHKALILYLWLSYRYVNVFKDQEMAFHAKELVEERINTTLLEYSANPKLRKRLLKMKEAAVGLTSDLVPPKTELINNREPSTDEVMHDPTVDLVYGNTSIESDIQTTEFPEIQSAAASS